MLTIKENYNDVDEFNLLYNAVGWGAYDKNITKKALDNTFYSVSIYNDNEIIGYGRLIGDTICFIFIHKITSLRFQSIKLYHKKDRFCINPLYFCINYLGLVFTTSTFNI